MFGITLHNTETEEAIGTVYPLVAMNMPDFDDILRASWTEFQSIIDSDYPDGISIEDFIEWHNKHNVHAKVQIDYIIIDFIQL